MNQKFSAFASLILICVLASCKKDSSTKPNDKNSQPVTNIYVAGYIDEGPNSVAVYWKNGVVTKLSGGTSSVVSGIAVSSDDVYAVGHRVATNNLPVATYWKNGVRTDLADSTAGSAANGIAIDGANVYITGYVRDRNNNTKAAYWKNGVANVFNDTFVTNSVGFAIAAKDNDVYVAGVTSSLFRTDATYWKNGAAVILSPGDKATAGILYGIAVNGGTVSAAGQVFGGSIPGVVSAFWQNGTPSLLTDNKYYSIAQGVFVQGADVYVPGNNSFASGVRVAGYWKNGIFTALGDGVENSNAAAIVTDGSDVYTAGSNKNVGFACYWKNGTLVQLANSSSLALSIVVVTKAL